MMPCQRTAAPPLLTEHGDEVARTYADRRAADPAYLFTWPRRGGRSLREVVREALVAMTGGRCNYCDAYPIGASGKKEIDHFHPKSRPEFYRMVCTWENLFLACSACNSAKREQWEETLLRPDEVGYAFERYFYYEPSTGALSPAPYAAPDEQHRARRTIEIFGLNRGDKCKARQIAARAMRRAAADELGEFSDRYLLAIVRD